ncbi:MAG: Imm5 family immunity protein [Polyangiales bacterium]|nr:hypothetical protein [Sandaracinaceae bacterium]
MTEATRELRMALDACAKAVDDDDGARMPFALRRAMLRALGPQELDERGFGTVLVPGKVRRLQLALNVCHRVAPLWFAAFGTTVVSDLLVSAERYMHGEIDLSTVRARTNSLQGQLMNSHQGHVEAYLAGRAAAACGWVAVGDELLVPDDGVSQAQLDDPDDDALWDPAFFAAGAEAGGMPWEGTHNTSRYRNFWRWYLEEAVPTSFSSV